MKKRKNIEKIEIENLFNATKAAVQRCDMARRKRLFLPKSFFLYIHEQLLAHDHENAGKYRSARYSLEIPGATFQYVEAWKIEAEIIETLDFINNKRKWRKKFRIHILDNLSDKNTYEKEYLEFIYKLFIAWFVHHRIAIIHPFADGNGRLARLVMCLILRHEKLSLATFPPLINKIINEDKKSYLKALSAGDGDDFVSGVKYMIEILDKAYRESEKEIKRKVGAKRK